ncbi:MAG TPA: hypothetical protein VML19_12965 [Verrucomicrobiae bacterium]|nr:hypothetical protein [Verrucomicrobiae bacterium]
MNCDVNSLENVPVGASAELVDGRTSTFAATPPSTARPQSRLQQALDSVGPTGVLAPSFLQQHLPWLRQQEHAADPSAASGARDAKDNSTARHTAAAKRAMRQ